MKPELAEALFGTAQPTHEQIQARNAEVTHRLTSRLNRLQADERDAVAALRSSASASASTETVTLPGGVTLEVRTRVPPSLEALQERLDAAQSVGRMAEVKDLACEMIACMVASPTKFRNPEVWSVAAEADDAGAVWLIECADAVLGPLNSKAERMRGNREPSNGTRAARKVKPSGA